MQSLWSTLSRESLSSEALTAGEIPGSMAGLISLFSWAFLASRCWDGLTSLEGLRSLPDLVPLIGLDSWDVGLTLVGLRFLLCFLSLVKLGSLFLILLLFAVA